MHAPTRIALLLALLVGTLAAGADTVFTSINWLAAVPVPGVQFTDSSGHTCLKGNVCILRVESAEPRIAGRLQMAMDLAQQADGSTLLAGPAYAEVGVWDPAGTNFTSTGGVWDLYARGLLQTDGSVHYQMVGDGLGGAIAGLRMEATVQRAAGALFDVSIPYVVSGALKPPPTNRVEVVDNFDDNRVTGWTIWDSNGSGRLFETNQQLTVRGYWPGIRTRVATDTWAKGWKSISPRTLADGQTLERRVDLIRMNDSTTLVNTAICGNNVTHGYTLHFARQYVGISKWLPSFAALSFDPVGLPDNNVILALALTRIRTNLLITARVLEKGGQGAVLFERSLWDTPAVEPTLSSNQVYAATGLCYPWRTDVAGLPWFSFDYVDLEIYQENDGTLPEALAAFDNLELGTYDLPRISIQPAVQLSWPATGMNFAVESAPTAQGPWLPVEDPVAPGFQQMNLPQNYLMQFFRLRQAP